MKIDLALLVKEAAAVAKQAPDHLQEAAFNKVFEALMASHDAVGSGAPKSGSLGNRKAIKEQKPAEHHAGSSALEHLDRTKYPDIQHNDLALNNSLRLLKGARTDLDIDGLSAAAIAHVLVDKFRCKVTRQAVSMALNGAGRYVNRHNEGGLVIFRIMAPGEEYLDALKNSPQNNSKPAANRRGSRNKKRRKTAESRQSSPPTKTSPQKSASGTKAGPATGMSQLYDSGFFSSARTIADINGKLKHDLGRTFKQNELSPVLLRWLRNGKLTRNLNTDNQYEYKQP